MSLYIYKSDDTFKPSDEQAIELVDQIVNNYKNWDDDRVGQREQYKKIEETLYIDITHNDRSNDETVLLPQIYEQYNTLKAAIIKSNFQNDDMEFNVIGKNQDSQNNSALQKANLQDAMRKMKFDCTVENSLHQYLTKGEMISFTYWETKVEQTKRQMEVEEDVIHPETQEVLGTQKIKKVVNVPKIIYDGAKVVSVDPLSFVFDKNEINNWDSCNKITYTLSSPYDVVANEDYVLLEEDAKDFIAGVAQNQEVLETDKYYSDTYSGILGQQVTVLEVWGDIKLNDGTVLKNYVATIVADMFLARLEPNPYTRNPFAISRWMPDPLSCRGRSPLLVAVPINQVSSQILNGQLRGLKLTLNPPMLAPMDFFTQDRISLYPGKVIEYNDLFNGARQPTPYTFKDGLVGFDFLTLMEGKIEASTGGFKYMTGATSSKPETATATSATVTGQNTRLSMTIHIINTEWTVPTIENIAALQANTDFEDKEINTGKQDGVSQFSTITPEIRQGEYEYIYGDSQSVVETEAKMQKVIAMVSQFGDKTDNINYSGLVKLIFNKMNIKDADQIIEPDPIDQAIQKMMPKPLPPQMLRQVKQQFAESGMLEQVIQQMMQMQQEQAQMQAQQAQGGQPNGTVEQGNPGTPSVGGGNAGVAPQPDMGQIPPPNQGY